MIIDLLNRWLTLETAMKHESSTVFPAFNNLLLKKKNKCFSLKSDGEGFLRNQL